MACIWKNPTDENRIHIRVDRILPCVWRIYNIPFGVHPPLEAFTVFFTQEEAISCKLLTSPASVLLGVTI